MILDTLVLRNQTCGCRDDIFPAGKSRILPFLLKFRTEWTARGPPDALINLRDFQSEKNSASDMVRFCFCSIKIIKVRGDCRPLIRRHKRIAPVFVLRNQARTPEKSTSLSGTFTQYNHRI
jgi:hypothetical protein